VFFPPFSPFSAGLRLRAFLAQIVRVCFVLSSKKKKKILDQKSQLFSFFCPKFSPQKRDEACVVDKVFLIIIIIQTRILRLLLPRLKKKRRALLEEVEDASAAKRFSGTKYYRKQRDDDHQNHF